MNDMDLGVFENGLFTPDAGNLNRTHTVWVPYIQTNTASNNTAEDGQ